MRSFPPVCSPCTRCQSGIRVERGGERERTEGHLTAYIPVAVQKRNETNGFRTTREGDNAEKKPNFKSEKKAIVETNELVPMKSDSGSIIYPIIPRTQTLD